MRSPAVVGLVARREVVERVRTRGFRVGTAIWVLLAAALVVLPDRVGGGTPTYRVGLVGDASLRLSPTLHAAARDAGVAVHTRPVDDPGSAAAALRDRTLHAALLDGDRVLTRGEPPEALAALLNRAAFETALAERLGPDAASVLDVRPLAFDRLETLSPARRANRPLAYAGTALTYFMLIGYGMVVANGVLEEKTSRVSEVLLSTIRPGQLLAGKLVGIGLVALIQLAAIGAGVAVAALAVGSFRIPPGTPWTFAAVALWVVLGYALYSSLFAAAAAAAGRGEELGNVTAPITITILVSYFVSVAAVADPDGPVATVASFVPPMAPMTMLPRAALGDLAPWEVPLSVALVVATTVAAVRLAVRIYAGAIGRRGGRVRLREAWRAAR